MSGLLLAIDPGSELSGYIVCTSYLHHGDDPWRLHAFGKISNVALRQVINGHLYQPAEGDDPELFKDQKRARFDGIVIEDTPIYPSMVPGSNRPYVKPEIGDTQRWIGRFVERAICEHYSVDLIDRTTVCKHLNANRRANKELGIPSRDSQVRTALINRFGGKDAAIGRKASPGPLYGVAADAWQALGLAVTWIEQQEPPF